MKSTSRSKSVLGTARRKLFILIAAAKQHAESTHEAAHKAKAALKDLRKTHKQAKKAAKDARRALKELKRKLAALKPAARPAKAKKKAAPKKPAPRRPRARPAASSTATVVPQSLVPTVVPAVTAASAEVADLTARREEPR